MRLLKCQVIGILAIFKLTSSKRLLRRKPEGQNSSTSVVTNDIIGGTDANSGEFPYFTLIQNKDGSTHCGGVLIHEDIVATAGHCVDGQGDPGIPSQVRLGPTTLSNGIVRSVCNGTIHPSFQLNGLKNDIAVLQLCSSVTNTPAVINQDSSYPVDNQELIAMGFGLTSVGGSTSSKLKKLPMNVVATSICSTQYQNYNPDNDICIDKTNAGICFGDSGSPAVDINGTFIGVASFIINSCDSKFPDFFTRVSSYSAWLRNQICNFSANPPAECATTMPPTNCCGGCIFNLCSRLGRLIPTALNGLKNRFT